MEKCVFNIAGDGEPLRRCGKTATAVYVDISGVGRSSLPTCDAHLDYGGVRRRVAADDGWELQELAEVAA